MPSGLSLPWLLALIGGGFVASLAGLLLVNWIGTITLSGVAWWGGNLVAWAALCFLLAGTEQPKIMWIIARSTRLVEFATSRPAGPLPYREIALAACFFALVIWNWARTFSDSTVLFALAAAALGIARVRRRSPFSRWQWIGAGLLILRQAFDAFGPSMAGWPAAATWFEVVLWWLITHRAVKREDDAVAARLALTRASYYIADGQFSLAEEQVRSALPLATTKEIAAAALQVLAASLAPQLRLAEAERALKGSLELNPADEDAKKRIKEIRRIQLV